MLRMPYEGEMFGQIDKVLRRIRFLPVAPFLVVLGVILAGCASSGPHVRSDSKFLSDSGPPTGASVTTFYALGDWGTGWEQQRMVADALKKQIEQLDPKRAAAPFVVGLGDNVYEKGLVSGWGNPETLDLLSRTFGEPYSKIKWNGAPVQFHVVPGNHDYGAGMTTGARKSGYGDVIHQETTAEGLYEGFNYYPLNYPGKPDSNDEAEYDDIRSFAQVGEHPGPLPEYVTRPETVEIPPEAPLVVIAIDTQAMIERSLEGDVRINEPTWQRLDSLLATDDPLWKFVIGHHPIQTYSSHGTYRTIDNWLWTGSGGRVASTFNGPRMTLLTSGLFIGALIHPAGWVAAGLGLAAPALSVLGDEIVKHPQDGDHWAYRAFADSLEEILARHGAIYLSGHDHSLQLIEVSGRTIQVVSGSAGKSSWVASRAPELHYSASKPGFVRIDLTESRMWMRFCTVEVPGDDSECGPTFSFTRDRGAVASSP